MICSSSMVDLGEMDGLWREILGIANVDPATDFFEAGGNSLHAARLVARIEEKFGVALDFPDFFAHPTLREMATLVAARSAAAKQLST
jgi:acyl carrier protein